MYAQTGPHPEGVSALALAGNCITIVGLMAALWFNYRVFYASERGGLLVTVAASLMMWAALVYFVAAGGLEHPAQYGEAYWPLAFSMVLADAWVAGEALRFRTQLLRRLALGLADPVVVDRLGLWSAGAIARIGLVLMAPLTNALVPSAELRMEIAPGLLLLSALLILGTCVAYWLMLAPTDGYRRWVARRYATAAS